MCESIRLKYRFKHDVINFSFSGANRCVCMFLLLTVLVTYPIDQTHARQRLPKLTFDKEEYYAGEAITVTYPDDIDPKTADDDFPDFLYGVIVTGFEGHSTSSSRSEVVHDHREPFFEKNLRTFRKLSEGNNKQWDHFGGFRFGGIFQTIVKLDRDVSFLDITFQLTNKNSGPVGEIYHFRVRPYVGTVPSALNVVASETSDEPVVITVTPPELNEFTLFETAKRATWRLKLYQLGVPFLGGYQSMDNEIYSRDLKAGVSQQVVWESIRNIFHSGHYELRLEVDIETGYWGGNYVVARKRFTQRPQPEPLSFGLKETTVPRAGEKFAYRYYGKTKGNIDVDLYRIDPVGRLRLAGENYISETTGETNVTAKAFYPGTYLARLRRGVHWKITLDNLRLDIPRKRETDYPLLLTTYNEQVTFFEGDDISVFVHAKGLIRKLKARTGGFYFDKIDDLSVSLYPKKPRPSIAKAVKELSPSEKARIDALDQEYQKVYDRLGEATAKEDKKATEKCFNELSELIDEKNKIIAPDPPPAPSEPLKSWQVELGKDGTLLIEGKYPPGEYMIKIECVAGDHPTWLYQKNIAILPRFEKNPIDLGGKEHFEVGSNIEVSLPSLPERLDYILRLAGEGGFGPGCVYVSPPNPEGIRIEGKGTVSLPAPNFPGIYYIRLCSGNQGLRVLSEVRIEVFASTYPENTITMDKTTYAPKEDMLVTVNPQAVVHYSRVNSSPTFYWRILSMGHVVSGGAVKPISDSEWFHFDSKEHREKSATVKAPGKPGDYAIILYGWDFELST